MRTPTTTVVALSAAALVVAGCGSDDPTGAGGDDTRLQVVASTNVWASVAAAVGGDAVEVTGIIDDPAADPHSYESTPADAATVSDADLVLYNGGGYDEFMTDVLSSAGGDIPTVDAFALSGHAEEGDGEEGAGDGGAEETHAEGEEHGDEEHEHGAVNEHVWYDLPTVEAVADAVAAQLAELDPADAATFTANADAFTTEVTAQLDRVTALDGAGTDVVATEPVADYLVEAAGLTLVSPADFVEAIEEESDPSAAAVAEMDDLLTGGTVGLLVFNAQTVGPVTEAVRTTAEDAGVPVVEVTETLPEGTDYLQWMDGQITALESALSPA